MIKLDQTLQGAVCDSSAGFCKWDKPCDQVTTSLDFVFRMSDGVSGSFYQLSIPGKHLKVDGSEFGEPNTCHYGVYKSASDADKNFIGTVLMKEYYVIFDMSPYDQFNQDFIQIGLGLKASGVDIAALRYDYNSSSYAPESKDTDSSSIMSGFLDQYG